MAIACGFVSCLEVPVSERSRVDDHTARIVGVVEAAFNRHPFVLIECDSLRESDRREKHAEHYRDSDGGRPDVHRVLLKPRKCGEGRYHKSHMAFNRAGLGIGYSPSGEHNVIQRQNK